MKKDNELKIYEKKDYPSHQMVVSMLEDPHAFYIRGEPSMKTRFVGKYKDGNIVYVEYILGPGDHYMVIYMREANDEEKAFFHSDL